jgi:predicted lipoprotein with Yx(FWY)xxD motif
MKTKQLIQSAALAMSVLALNPAMAHGVAQPSHGGTVQEANDVSFELVVDADGVTLYLTDHDEPLSSKGISGKLTVLQGTQKTEADVKPAGDNKLRATGLKVGAGAKVVAVLNKVEGQTVTLRFTVK